MTGIERIEADIVRLPWCGCWVWMGHTMKPYAANPRAMPYGRLIFNGSRMLAHRFAWSVYRGHLPKSALVLHRCDNPCCVNPQHLFLGSQQENIEDRNQKQRQARGVSNASAKLTEDQVQAIRGGAKRDGEWAQMLGVTKSTVRHARTRRTWRHI
jgi:hypothetical protein